MAGCLLLVVAPALAGPQAAPPAAPATQTPAERPPGAVKPRAPQVSSAGAPAKATDGENKRQLARIYQEQGRLEEARKKLEEALGEDPQNAQAQADLKQLLKTENERTRARQALWLEQAEWQLRNGERGKAVELIQKAADSAQDPKIIAQGLEVMRRASGLSLEQLLDRLKGSWLVDAIFAIVIVAVLGALLCVVRRVWTALYLLVFRRRTRPAWRVRPINDSTKMAVADLVMAELSRLSTERLLTPTLSSGLLKVGAYLLPRPRSSPGFEQGPAVTLAEPASALQMKIGGFEVGGLTRMLSGLGAWFGARLPALTGGAVLSQDNPPRVMVWLTCYGQGRKITTVRESAAVEPGSDGARTSAETTAFRMYYLLTYPGSTESDANAMLAMRRGYAFLQAYLDGKDAQALGRARQSFAEAHGAVPTLWEAHLYEGVALDLLERHEEAVQRFQYVAANTEGELREQALYSEAIAHLRMYRPEHLQSAAGLCDQIISAGTDIVEHPIRLLAKVGKANAIAHYPIFWERLLHGGEARDDDERSAWKKRDVRQVYGWVNQVIAITGDVDANLGAMRAATSPKWDARAQRQIEWGKLNALGNAYLNVAYGFLEPPLPAELSDAAAIQEGFLTIALEAFKTCEPLLTPSIETITNFATTYLFLGRYSEARAYLDRAIALNPDYEYAYYRRAQSWDRQKESEKARQVLAAHSKPVHITEFKTLFAKYGVPLPS